MAMDPRLQQMIDEMKGRPGAPPTAAADIQAAFESSEFLLELATLAVRNGQMHHLSVTDRPHAGGFVSRHDGEQTVHISPSVFTFSPEQRRIDALTDALGHEISHTMTTDQRLMERNEYATKVMNSVVNADRNETVNITAYARRYQEFTKVDESTAAVAGMNALASRVTHLNHGVFDESNLVARSNSLCVDTGGDQPKLAEGLSLNKSGYLDATPQRLPNGGVKLHPNVQAAQVCYYGAPATAAKLGLMGDSDYANYYGTDIVKIAADTVAQVRSTDNAPNIRLDLKDMRLDGDQIERNGLDLQRNAFSVIDGSDAMNTVTFKKSMTRVRGHAQDRGAPEPPTPELSATPLEEGHPDFATFQTLQQGIRAAYRKDGREADPDTIDRSAGALLVAIKQDNNMVRRVDEVTVGRPDPANSSELNVFAVYKPFGNKAPMFEVAVDAKTAADQSLYNSFAQVQVLNQQQTQQEAIERQQALQKSQETPDSPKPPILAR